MTGNNRIRKLLIIAFLVTTSLFVFLSPVSAAEGNIYYYQVQPGDFLWLIGWRFETTADKIISYNHLGSAQIYPGQGLMIPQSTGYVREIPKSVTYSVKKGDTLFLIAQRFGTTIAKIKDASKLTSDSIWIGQSLNVPLPLQKRYTVQKGDTLYIISNKFNVNVEALMSVNRMTSQILWIGQVLFVPDTSNGSQTSGSGTQVPGTGSQPADSGTQVPGTGSQPADSGTQVPGTGSQPADSGTQTPGTGSQQPDNGGSTPDVGTLPPVSSMDFSKPLPAIGQWGQIPPGVILYRVQSGDNLWVLAQRYHTTENAISLTNHLHSDILQINQSLFIPQNSIQPVSVPNPIGLKKDGYGELMDWQYDSWILDTGIVFTVQDILTGKTFKAKRYGGSNHVDAEPVTAADSAVMNEIFGGQWSWATRPVLVSTDGEVLAGSIAGMPHSFDSIPDNNFDGHFDVYFLNCTSHNTNELSPEHQKDVLKAAGY